MKAKIKSYWDKVNTNFQGKKIPKENLLYKFLSQIIPDFVIRVSKRYYPPRRMQIWKKKDQNGKSY